MKIVEPRFELIYPATPEDAEQELRKIERMGRICYKSEYRISTDSYIKFISNIIKRGHLSVIEHGIASAIITTDRGITHEIVRHRLASYSQESTRYCNYSKARFGNEITIIQPPGLKGNALRIWQYAVENAEAAYLRMRDYGVAPQIARSVLPNSLKAEIGITANFREWLHIFKLRTSQAAHPQIREVMISGQKQLADLVPVVFRND